VTYAQDVRRFENEADAIAAVFAAWPDASISIMIDEVERREHAVIWKDAASAERYDQPVGWVAREVKTTVLRLDAIESITRYGTFAASLPATKSRQRT
jgi:hypothetical protein